MSKPSNYELRFAKAQEFYGYDSPGAALTAAADFSNTHDDSVYAVSLRWSETTGYGITVLWEDCNK